MRIANTVIRSHTASAIPSVGSVVLPHDERHLRRKRLTLLDCSPVMVDLAQATHLQHGDRLKTQDGAEIEILAAPEALTEIRANSPTHHAQLCWHIGNRHLKAQIEPNRILILRDKVIDAMLEGLDAQLTFIEEPFHPMAGAYHTHNQTHHHHDHVPSHGSSNV